MTRNTKFVFFAGLGLALLIGLGVAFGGARDDEDAYSWDAISRGGIRETISASGEIRAKTQINIGTSVAGEIKAIHVKDGQDVKAGDLLVTIDQVRLREQVAQAAAALDAARKDANRLEFARQRARESFGRYEALRQQGLISDEDYRQQKLNRESTELTYQSAKANVAQSEANLKAVQDGLSKATLRAPIAGKVTSLKAEMGETAIPGMSNLPGATLMIISDMSEMQAEIKVNESEVVRTQVGQTAQVNVESLPGTVFQGTVIEVATGTEGTGTDANLYKVKVLLKGDREDLDKLRPGMSARAVILTHEAKHVLRVPLQAVLEREGSLEDAQKQGLLAPATRNIVMLFKNGKALERQVDVGIANTQYFELKGGLAEGDKVLTGPLRKLKTLKDKATIALRARSDSDLAKTPAKSLMDIREPLAAAVRALKANKLRSALTTLGIIIGVAAVIVVVSLVQGLKTSVLKQVERAGSQTLFVRPVFPMDMPFAEYTKIKNKDLTLDNMHALARAVPQITQVTPLFFNGTDVKFEGRSANVNLIMTDETYLELNSINLTAGRNFVPSDLRLGNKVAIIGPRVIDKLGIKGNPLGRIISTPTLSLEVIGVLEEQGAQLGNDPDQNILIPLSTGMAQLTEAQRRQLFFQARVDPRLSADDGAELVEDALRRIRGLRGNEPSGFKVFSPKQITGIISGITGTITAVAGGMVSIALLVGGIGIMNIMLVSVTERTREIGIRKAVGAKRGDILLQFLIEASFLCILGGAIGVGLGYIIGAALGKALLGTMGAVPLWAVVSAFAVPAAIGLIFGLYPAAKASKLDPIEALRYE